MLLSRYLFEWMLLKCFFAFKSIWLNVTSMLFCLWKYLIEYYLAAFCLYFKCLKFFSWKKNKIKNCPDSLNIYTTYYWHSYSHSHSHLSFLFLFSFYFHFHSYYYHYYYYYFNHYNQYLTSIINFPLLCLTLNLSLHPIQNVILIQCLWIL